MSYIVATIEFVAKASVITNYDPSKLEQLNLLIILEAPMDERILKGQNTVSCFNSNLKILVYIIIKYIPDCNIYHINKQGFL